MGSSEARLRSYDSILPLESIEHLKLKIIHIYFFPARLRSGGGEPCKDGFRQLRREKT